MNLNDNYKQKGQINVLKDDQLYNLILIKWKNHHSIKVIIKLILISLIILLLLLYFRNNNYDPEFFKYQNMLPRLNPSFNNSPFSIKQIFEARQIYISDTKITPEYIRFIRPIDEKQEKKYNKSFSENITIIENELFDKRPDQYNFDEFCKIALNETLIYNNMENTNKPIISVILPSYNKKNILLKSVRSIQNQKFNNIEIIIVNDCSNDNSSEIFDQLLKTDKRIRIFHHLTNMGLYRSRLDGILYSNGKYIIAFDTGDLYDDNYVLLDIYNIVEKYNLDSCKFLFRIIGNFSNLNEFYVPYHAGNISKIVYQSNNIKIYNDEIFNTCGNIWNRLVRSNIYIKAIYLLNELMLNVYKNMWEDVWYNEIVNKVSYSYAIVERVGYIYFYDGQGEGTPKYETIKQKSNIIKEYVAFLYFDYNFCSDSLCKVSIMNKLRNYNEKNDTLKLKNFRAHFEVLNNLLEALIKDPDLIDTHKKYCERLLNESKIRETNNSNIF